MNIGSFFGKSDSTALQAVKSATVPRRQQLTVESTAEAVDAPPKESILSPAIEFTGAKIRAAEDMVIYGKFLDGELNVRRLTVMAGAEVTGTIKAEHIRSHGTMRGSIEAAQFIIHKGSLTEGDIRCGTFGVQPGSVFHARVDADTTQQIGSDAANTLPTAATGFEQEFSSPAASRVVEFAGNRKQRA